MPAVPEPCECGSRMYRPVWGVYTADETDGDKNRSMQRQGFKCEECERLQLTREIPEVHAQDSSLDLPDSADRDMVQE